MSGAFCGMPTSACRRYKMCPYAPLSSRPRSSSAWRRVGLRTATLHGGPAASLAHAGVVVVEPGQPRSLPWALETLAAGPERRTLIGWAGRRCVTENFDWRIRAEGYCSLITQLAGRQPNAAL